MSDGKMSAFVFKNRGLLLALPAIALVIFGRPSLASIAVGLTLAIAGELVRCWAVGFSGTTTRGNVVTAAELVTAGPYSFVRNPLYLGNFVTAAGFAIAFTGSNALPERGALILGSLAVMTAVYATIVPHEERFLRAQFGEAFERYCRQVPRIFPRFAPAQGGNGAWRAGVLLEAESKTFALFGVMLVALALRAFQEFR